MSKITLLKSIFSISVLLCSSAIIAQIQKGTDIDGESAGDRSGFSVCMPNVNIIAIGAPQNDVNGGNSGHVRVFEWLGSNWSQRGADLDGEATGDLFGSSVSMPNVTTIAIGAPQSDVGDVDSGQVKIFEWDGTNWNQKGSTLQGDITSGFFGGLFGSSVSMPNENSIAIGAPWFDTTGTFSGQVKIFDWNGNDWVQRGTPISGNAFSYTGSIVKMPTNNVVAIVTQGATAGNRGIVNIYEWNGSQWLLKGASIVGESAGDYSGSSIDMPDENTIAIGASDNDGSFAQSGHTRIFVWDGNSWIQKGADINGEAENDESGHSVSMPDANTVAIGAILNDGNGNQSGHVRVFKWNGATWVQSGVDIDGEAANDHSGYSVSMPDANTVAIGAIQNDAINGNQFSNETGHVRIYNLETTLNSEENSFSSSIKNYPNPTSENLTIDFGNKLDKVILVVRNSIGQKVQSFKYESTQYVNLKLPETKGLYLIEILSESNRSVLRVIKK